METPNGNFLFFLKNFLSNFHACKFTDENGIQFSNTEQYFMYHKAITFGDFDVAKAIHLPAQAAQKRGIGLLRTQRIAQPLQLH